MECPNLMISITTIQLTLKSTEHLQFASGFLDRSTLILQERGGNLEGQNMWMNDDSSGSP
jgi:hypothetical protein